MPGRVPADGVLLVDKPGGLTSHDVVARVRRLAATKKVGHAGTLDPMATGLLVLGLGRGTRLLTYLVGANKTYEATIRLGQATRSDDADGDVVARPGASGLDEEALAPAVAALTGPIMQRPSAVSAIKVDGVRSYARVRSGEDVELPARPVVVHAFTLANVRPATADDATPVTDVDVVVTCSSGTYIRALARDLGDQLGTGGHLTRLRRTRVGPFAVSDAATLDELADRGQEGPIALLPLADTVGRVLPRLELDAAATADLRHGRPVREAPADGIHGAFAPDGSVVALVENRGGRARAVLVLDPA